MLYKEKILASESKIISEESNNQNDTVDNQIDTLLALGSLKLGLNNLPPEGPTEKSLLEDLKKISKFSSLLKH